jgi:CBS domain-containing protein
MRRVTGATPLIALDAVAIDTETTGLDTARARIVQIGGVGITAGRLAPGPTIETLVAPDIAIPSASSGIHGVTDAMVRNAPDFATAWAEFLAFARGRVLIGHSIGFDLAILKREARRAGLAWKKPRSLCVRLLAAAADPNLPDYSLETLADWLDIPIAGRHSALGDATAAANIFLALLPRLHDRNIRTLAEAERACLKRTTELDSAHRAGWIAPVSAPAAPAFQSVDPYAYRHRVGELMSHAPLVVRSSAIARDVVSLMVDRKVSSVFVSDCGTPERPVDHYGIVTERDMMRRIAAHGEHALERRIGDIAIRPLVSIRAQAFVYRAIGRMNRLKIRHLAVRDERNRLAGIVSARDLLRLRGSAAINLDDAIEASGSVAEMAAAWATLPMVTDALIAEGIDARMICEIISEELRAMTRRAAILAEAAMMAEGRGAPPCPYAVLVLGSGGRGESLLAADQDNAIVFAEGDPEGLNDRWFAMLGAKIADMLDASGIPYCKGGVMAKNAAFRGSTALWRSRIDDWIRRSRPKDLLNVDIFFDLRPVYGDLALSSELFDYAYECGRRHAEFAKLLGELMDEIPSPFTLLGRFKLEGGRVDLKMHGLFPIVATARTLAIRHGIRAHSTSDRLDALVKLDIGGDADFDAMRSGHSLLLSMLLQQQSHDLHAGLPVSNKIEPGRFDRAKQAELKSVLKQLQSAPDLVRDLMFG